MPSPARSATVRVMEDLLTRAVTDVVPKDLAKKKLESGQKLRLYLGIDPTSPKLHLGHAAVLRKLREFQNAGHHVILLFGSFTAMIGDPTGKDKMRVPLTREQVDENMKTYVDQAAKILDAAKTEIVYNHEWLDKVGFEEIARMAGAFTVQQMLERDMFEQRMDQGNPIGLHEFFYPLMVGYDSVMLDVDLEVGGNDQLFNMLAGRTLQQAYGKREKFVLTVKLLEGTDGRKMSKSFDNCVWLTDPPQEMFGKIMRVEDRLMPVFFECCTDVAMEEIKRIEKELKLSPVDEATDSASLAQVNPRDLKLRLAREIVTIYHGVDAALHAEEQFKRVFSNKELPEEMDEVTAEAGSNLIDLLIERTLIPSKSEARRLIEQGGIHLNDEKLTALEQKIGDGLTPDAWRSGVVVKVGKRKFLRIKL